MIQIESQYNSLKKDKDFCWMVSQCHVYNERFDLAAQIINNLPGKIHMWGKATKRCLAKANKSKIIDHGFSKGDNKSGSDLTKCKFYFAFENSNCSDYITEKFARSLRAYAIPIVNGWRESYEQQLPGSFIHVADFVSSVHLTEKLSRLLANKKEMLAYQKWRLNYEVLTGGHLSMFDFLPCRICEKLSKIRDDNEHGIKNVEIIPELSEHFRNFQKCVSR